MVNVDVNELGISKNLLQMNFMRRTLVAKEKASNQALSDILPDSQEYEFKLPCSVEECISKKARVLKSRYRFKFIRSIFKLYNLSPGFRESFGGFNHPQSVTSNPLHSLPSNQSDSVCKLQKEASKSSGSKVSKTSIRFRKLINPKPSNLKNSRDRKGKRKSTHKTICFDVNKFTNKIVQLLL
ncbi:unnamed protein product [Heterobilharzia americana]|nr:unnamed protein product [Heterobilharzia americana]